LQPARSRKGARVQIPVPA